MTTNAQTEAREIAEDAYDNIANGYDLSGMDRKDVVDAFAVFFATALAAKDAEIETVKADLVAAWNAFGPSSTRSISPDFDVNDLDHLPVSANGSLAEQIRCLEGRAERAERKLAELRDRTDAIVSANEEMGLKLAEANKALDELREASNTAINFIVSLKPHKARFSLERALMPREQGGK